MKQIAAFIRSTLAIIVRKCRRARPAEHPSGSVARERLRSCVAHARANPESSAYSVSFLLEELDYAGLKAEDIGETAVSLAEIHLLQTKAQLRVAVAHSRAVPTSDAYSVSSIYERLARAGLKPKDIGETDDSLTELDRLQVREQTRRNVAHCRAVPSSTAYSPHFLLSRLQGAGLKPEDIGETAESISALGERAAG